MAYAKRRAAAARRIAIASILALAACAVESTAPLLDAVSAARFLEEGEEGASDPSSGEEAQSRIRRSLAPNPQAGTMVVSTWVTKGTANFRAFGWWGTDEQRDVSPNGSVAQSSPNGDFDQSSTVKGARFDFTTIIVKNNCGEVGDVLDGWARGQHAASWGLPWGAEITSSVGIGCSGPTPAISGTVVIREGQTSQRTSNCVSAANRFRLSDNPSIATVDANGLVSGHVPGSTYITVECFGVATNKYFTVEAAPGPVTRTVPEGEGGTPNCGYFQDQISYDGGNTWHNLGEPYWDCEYNS